MGDIYIYICNDDDDNDNNNNNNNNKVKIRLLALKWAWRHSQTKRFINWDLLLIQKINTLLINSQPPRDDELTFQRSLEKKKDGLTSM